MKIHSHHVLCFSLCLGVICGSPGRGIVEGRTVRACRSRKRSAKTFHCVSGPLWSTIYISVGKPVTLAAKHWAWSAVARFDSKPAPRGPSTLWCEHILVCRILLRDHSAGEPLPLILRSATQRTLVSQQLRTYHVVVPRISDLRRRNYLQACFLSHPKVRRTHMALNVTVFANMVTRGRRRHSKTSIHQGAVRYALLQNPIPAEPPHDMSSIEAIPATTRAAVTREFSIVADVVSDYPLKAPSELAPGECILRLECTGCASPPPACEALC